MSSFDLQPSKMKPFVVDKFCKRRQMIRQMHEIIHPTEYQKSFHVFFLIGQQEIPDQEAEKQLVKEKFKYSDIIEYDQIDNYS